MEGKKVNCLKCKYFYVTWDPHSPRGCRVFGFKTDKFPSLLVKNETGKECLSFKEKTRVKETNQ